MRITYPNEKDIAETNKLAAEFFGTENDPEQAQPTMDNALNLIDLEKNNFLCIKDGNRVVAWSVVLPTSENNMNGFLTTKIVEKDLLSDSINNPKFESLYLMSVIVLPDYRQKGLGYRLLAKQINYYKNNFFINKFYADVFSKEGLTLLQKLETELQINLSLIDKSD